jgi:hypothetical protein
MERMGVSYDGAVIRADEAHALDELAAAVRAARCRDSPALAATASAEGSGIDARRLTVEHGYLLEADAVVELAVRDCSLTALLESVGRLASLTHLDLRSNRLRALPDSLADLAKLEKLDLRWNKLTRLPGWIEQLERRGCTVLL